MAERHGTTRVIRGWGKVHGACPNLSEIGINGKVYLLTRTVNGMRLISRDPLVDMVYTVTADGCSCPDTVYRNPVGGCKHVKALAALTTAGKL